MPDELPKRLALDPWATSSLLQKAIRRGEVELARRAASTLYHQRGLGTFRRLCTIAVEDIGIADPELLAEVVRLATDKQLRALIGADAAILCELTGRMALAVKDRSADYLISAVTRLDTAKQEQKQLASFPADQLIKIAAADHLPLIRRGSAALLVSTAESAVGSRLLPKLVERLLDSLPVQSSSLSNAVLRLASARGEPFCLLLPLLWSRWCHFGAKFTVTADEMPTVEFVNGIPLYTWDKHTAAGKSAIRRFARENGVVAAVLAKWVREHHRANATAIAAFYADAAPVARRLDWPTGTLLQQIGSCSDMMEAGCKLHGVAAVLQSVRDNLPHLNQLRRAELGRGAAKRAGR
jgi:hypothetical protein